MRNYFKKIFLSSIVVVCFMFLTFTTVSKANSEISAALKYREYRKPLVSKLVSIPLSEQDSLKANALRSELTGLSIQEIQDFRTGKEAFYLNNAEIYNIVFSDSRRNELLTQFGINAPFGSNNDFNSILSSSVTKISEGKYNYAISPDNRDMNCYGFALGRSQFINPGEIAYGGTRPVLISPKTIVSIDTLKDYVITDLKALGRNPVVVSSSYVANSNEQIIVVRKGVLGDEEDYHFVIKHKLDGKWWHKPGETSLLQLKSNSLPLSSKWIPESYTSTLKLWRIPIGGYDSKAYFIKYTIK